MSDAQPTIRSMDAADDGIVKWVLYEAVTWDDPPDAPPFEIAVEHPELLRFHAGWGRRGDFGVAAESDGALIGAAYARLFTEDDHGWGFVDEATPEIAIAVDAGHQRRGIGRKLMDALAVEAGAHGIERLSLSVQNANGAKDLYLDLGYEVVNDDGKSSVMVLEL